MLDMSVVLSADMSVFLSVVSFLERDFVVDDLSATELFRICFVIKLSVFLESFVIACLLLSFSISLLGFSNDGRFFFFVLIVEVDFLSSISF